MSRALPEGKLPPELLARLLAYTSRSPELRVAAAVGEDAAVVPGAETLVLTTDPITFAAERVGAYAVAVNANDIVAMGGTPRYLTTTILAPSGCTAEELEAVFADLADACRTAGVAWVGGHTEVTSSTSRVVVVGQCVGFLAGEPLSTGGARPGDLLAMSKWVGLEGTTTVARRCPAQCERVLGARRFREVLGWLDRPGISIVAEGRALAGMELSSGHDPTEGGVAMGVHEIASCSRCGVVIHSAALPVREETRLVCARFGLDPLGLLASGVLLFTARPAVAEAACRRLGASGIPATVIGEMLGPEEGEWLERDAVRAPLEYSAQDEIVRLSRRRRTGRRRAGPARPGRCP